MMNEKFKRNDKILVDTWNLTVHQRKNWISQAMKLGVLKIEVIYFDIPKETCQEALKAEHKTRQDHDEIFRTKITKPEQREGFGEIIIVKNTEDINKAVLKFT